MPANVVLAAFGLAVVSVTAWGINMAIEAARLGGLG